MPEKNFEATNLAHSGRLTFYLMERASRNIEEVRTTPLRHRHGKAHITALPETIWLGIAVWRLVPRCWNTTKKQQSQSQQVSMKNSDIRSSSAMSLPSWGPRGRGALPRFLATPIDWKGERRSRCERGWTWTTKVGQRCGLL